VGISASVILGCVGVWEHCALDCGGTASTAGGGSGAAKPAVPGAAGNGDGAQQKLKLLAQQPEKKNWVAHRDAAGSKGPLLSVHVCKG
jgi:hypothetical protein